VGAAQGRVLGAVVQFLKPEACTTKITKRTQEKPRKFSCLECFPSFVASGALHLPQEIHLAQFHTVLPQDAVRGHDVEEEIGDGPMHDVAFAGKLEFPSARGDRDFPRFLPVDVLGFEANEVSLSSHFGISWPVMRAQAPLATSVAICTWRVSANMSG
jgi:hypothetical protein